MAPEVSVIMPCYNQAAYVTEALESLKKQTFTNWECILVSDGSRDNVAEVVNAFCMGDDRFIFLNTENGGPSAARNFGITQAKAAFILPLDADDKISANYIEECLNTIKSSPEIKLVYGAGEKFGLVDEIWNTKKYSWDALLFGNMIHNCGMHRKTDWAKTGGYDINMRDGLEDWEYWINLLDKNAHVVKLETIKLYWRIKSISRTTLLKESGKVARANRYVYQKHATLYADYFTDPMQLYTKYKEVSNIAEYALANSFKFFLLQQWKKIKKLFNPK